ncbi:MAG: hypothetical protein ACRYFK_14365 [Janthinobacterium lividum]
MPAPSAFRDILQQIGEAIAEVILQLLNERSRYPLRPNSELARQLRSPEAVQVVQSRGANGRFGSYGLTLVALDYLQWLDTGRKPGGKKVPILAIIAFIKARGLRPRDRVSGRYVKHRTSTLKGRNGGPDISVNQLAFAIQNAIFRRGILGRHVLAEAWATGELLLDKLLDESALSAMSADLEAQFSYLATT